MRLGGRCEPCRCNFDDPCTLGRSIEAKLALRPMPHGESITWCLQHQCETSASVRDELVRHQHSAWLACGGHRAVVRQRSARGTAETSSPWLSPQDKTNQTCRHSQDHRKELSYWAYRCNSISNVTVTLLACRSAAAVFPSTHGPRTSLCRRRREQSARNNSPRVEMEAGSTFVKASMCIQTSPCHAAVVSP